MSDRLTHAARPLLIAALAYVVLAAASCAQSDPAGPEGTKRIHRELAVIGRLEVGGEPIVSHTVYFSTWKTDDAGEAIQGTDMHFHRTTDSDGDAVGSFGYDLLFDTESNRYLELVRCSLFATYDEQDFRADAYFTQNDLATGDTTKMVNLLR